jgi:hypothetical protein
VIVPSYPVFLTRHEQKDRCVAPFSIIYSSNLSPSSPSPSLPLFQNFPRPSPSYLPIRWEGHNVNLLDEGRDRRVPSPPVPDRQLMDQQPLTVGYSPGAMALARKGSQRMVLGPPARKGGGITRDGGLQQSSSSSPLSLVALLLAAW